uniref:CC0125/CC1285 family lipoprotein n=1 Tax=Variovorax sp. BK018 TaxID=3450241 RepID=UPI004039A83A
MNIRRLGHVALATGLLLALGGCATPYKSLGLGGGFQDSNGPGHLERVDFAGNGYSDPEKMKIFALYRAAETAQARKKEFFVMYDSLLSAARNRPSEMPRVGTIGGFPWAFAFIRFTDQDVTGANNTAEILKRYAEAVKSPIPDQK